MVHSAPTAKVPYFTGATNILYTFGGHAVTVYVFSLYLSLSLQAANLLACLPVSTQFESDFGCFECGNGC